MRTTATVLGSVVLLVAGAVSAEDRPPIPASPSNVIVQIAKRHNRAQADGRMALEMEVDFIVRGERGHDVRIAASFVDHAAGTPLRSALPSHADAAGNLVAGTRPVRVEQDAARYKATVVVPYAAFPRVPNVDSYRVEAQVHLVRVDSGGATQGLAAATTTFTVYSTAEAPPAK